MYSAIRVAANLFDYIGGDKVTVTSEHFPFPEQVDVIHAQICVCIYVHIYTCIVCHTCCCESL